MMAQKIETTQELQKKLETVLETLADVNRSTENEKLVEFIEKDIKRIVGFIDTLWSEVEVEIDVDWEFGHIWSKNQYLELAQDYSKIDGTTYKENKG
jgi:hypothetical protein